MFRARSASPRVGAVLLIVGSLSLAVPSFAQQQLPEESDGPPWPDAVVATLRSFFERVDVESVLDGVRAPRAAVDSAEPAAISARIPDSTRAPFRYVQTAVAHLTYTGSLLGARGTARAGAGNALDQALLLRALYEVRGRRTRLVRGRLGWRDAVALVGREPRGLERGDPWLRHLEAVADHWWLELQDGGGWVALDPSFADTGWGEARGRARSTHESVPSARRASVRVEVTGSSGPVGRAEIGLSELAGRPLVLFPVGVDPVPIDNEPAPGELDQLGRTDALDDFLESRRRPVGAIRLLAGGQTLDMPLVGAGTLSLALTIRRPLESDERLSLTFEPRRGERIVVAFHPGPAGPALGRAVAPLFASLRSLAATELAGLEAWVERPRPEGARDRDDRMMPAATADDAELAAVADADDVLPPWRALHLAGLRAWDEFTTLAPEAVALTALAALDRLAGRTPGAPPPFRVAAVRWSPPGPQRGGRLALWTRGPAISSATGGDAARGARAAGGFLHSALLGQVLHSVADAAPATAFDLTLRSVGSGQRLAWWRRGERLPASWPEAAGAVAREDLGSGRLLVGPGEAIGGADSGLHGWWAIDPGTGATTGRVVDEGEVTEAAIEFAPSLVAGDLESVLASLPDLHHAVRWLSLAADPDGAELGILLPRSCAATALVGDLLLAGAPAGFPAPQFASYCGGAASRGGDPAPVAAPSAR